MQVCDPGIDSYKVDTFFDTDTWPEGSESWSSDPNDSAEESAKNDTEALNAYKDIDKLDFSNSDTDHADINKEWTELQSEIVNPTNDIYSETTDPPNIISKNSGLDDTTLCDIVSIINRVRNSCFPNRFGLQIPIKSNWNIGLLKSLTI